MSIHIPMSVFDTYIRDIIHIDTDNEAPMLQSAII